jgi:hypothetical protein
MIRLVTASIQRLMDSLVAGLASRGFSCFQTENSSKRFHNKGRMMNKQD